jgi:hypothetical protein
MHTTRTPVNLQLRVGARECCLQLLHQRMRRVQLLLHRRSLLLLLLLPRRLLLLQLPLPALLLLLQLLQGFVWHNHDSTPAVITPHAADSLNQLQLLLLLLLLCCDCLLLLLLLLRPSMGSLTLSS